ncbi:MAG: hypothetical protein K6T34_06225 [Thermoflavifilum sp.]|nr:hypothetical protein [Thermoflavifilum sp.]
MATLSSTNPLGYPHASLPQWIESIIQQTLNNKITLITQAHTPEMRNMMYGLKGTGTHLILSTPSSQQTIVEWESIRKWNPYASWFPLDKSSNPETIVQKILWKYGQLHIAWLHQRWENAHQDLYLFWDQWIVALLPVLKSGSCIILSATFCIPKTDQQGVLRFMEQANTALRELTSRAHRSIRKALWLFLPDYVDQEYLPKRIKKNIFEAPLASNRIYTFA